MRIEINEKFLETFGAHSLVGAIGFNSVLPSEIVLVFDE